jgi:ABC-type multidrug transport system permease subunit
MIKCRAREFFREPSAFVFVILMPIVWMLALGFSFSNDRSIVYRIGLANDSALPSEIKNSIGNAGNIKVVEGSQDDLFNQFKRNDIELMVTYDEGRFGLTFDPDNPNAKSAELITRNIIQEGSGRKDVAIIESHAIKASGNRYVDFLIPGLIGLTVMTSSLFGVGMTMVANRRDQLLKRFLITPINAREYIVSHIFGRFFVLFFELTGVLLAGWLIFRFKVQGNFLSFLAFVSLGTAVFTALGILLASRLKVIGTYSGITNLITFLLVGLSGVFFSTAILPTWLQDVVTYLPLAPFVTGLRKLAIEAAPFVELKHEVGLMCVYLVGISMAAKRLFRWS